MSRRLSLETVSLTISLTATDGEVIRLPSDASGVAEGYARIGNPYWDGDTDWRFKDGDTCIGCDADDPRAMPVADAYQQLRAEWAEEQARFDAMIERQNEEVREAGERELWDRTSGRLYEAQDRLMGVTTH